jgi:basic membrane protein A
MVLIAAFMLAVGLVAGPFASLVTGQGSNDLCIVFDTGGRGDLSFNDMAALGADDAVADFGFNALREVGSNTDADYLPNLANFSDDGGCGLIVAIGFLLTDAIVDVADAFPNQSYAIIDGFVPDKANVQSVLYSEEQGSALMGALAQQVSAGEGGNNVGIVLGIEISVLWKFECGYMAGVRWADNNYDDNVFAATSSAGMTKTTTIQSNYTGSFGDPALGQSVGAGMLANGADFIYGVAGGTGRGMITAVAEAGRALGNETGAPFAGGVDANQDYLEGGGFVLASMMKRVDRGVYVAAEAVDNGTFTGGIRVLGLDNGGVSLSRISDFDTFLQLGIDAGEIDAADRDTFFNRATALREQFAGEFAVADALAFRILSGIVSVPLADEQAEIDACRSTYGD